MPTNREAATRGIVAVLALAAVGCSDPGDPTGAAREESPAPSRAQEAGQSLDHRFAGLNRQVPGFGGYFYDADGNLNVYLTHSSQRANAETALASVLGERRATARGKRNEQAAMVVRQGQFEFRQLDAWHGRLPAVLSMSGVVFTDIDEETNRIRVGVESAGLKPAVQARLAALGVPAAAVVVSETEPIRFMSTLRDYTRPVEGGLQISYWSGTSYDNVCTLGVNSTGPFTLYNYFITASHCSRIQGAAGSSPYFQPSGYTSPYEIGGEIADPAYWTGGQCPAGRRCRRSDSALGQYLNNVPTSFGKIARTEYWGTGSSPGSITINAANPHFTINGQIFYPAVGEYLDKVGRTTGWTYGRVNSTCVNVNVANSDITLLCQNMVGAGVGPGDSGSPVFNSWGGGNNVAFYGILWGGSSTQYTFSSWSYISQELNYPMVF